jgi:hypothetical protein
MKNIDISDFDIASLSYEHIIHNKVNNNNYNTILFIPEGKETLLWFTFEENTNKPICYILYIEFNKVTKQKTINDIQTIQCSFDNQLCYGTILYGTLFEHSSKLKCFTIQNIIKYKGKNISNEKWCNKFELFNHILTYELSQKIYNKEFIIIGLPFMVQNNKTYTIDDILEQLKQVNYSLIKVHYIQYEQTNYCKSLAFYKFKQTDKQYDNQKQNNHNKQLISKEIIYSKNKDDIQLSNKLINMNINVNNIIKPIKQNLIIATFLVRAAIQNDIYDLYCMNSNNLVKYNIACIPDYKTSVYMNSLFRNIKENVNLDTLEESDDEEDFENINLDKYVDLNKEYIMNCSYNYKFKKWVPLNISQDPIIRHQDLQYLERKK